MSPVQKKSTPITLTSVETDTILAALRSYQLDIDVLGGFDKVDAQIQDIATNGGDHPPLSGEQIDELCARLNNAMWE